MTNPTPTPSPEELLLVATIGGAHGIKGQLRLIPITDRVDHLQRKIRTLFIGPKRQAYQVRSLAQHKPGVMILTLEGVADRTAAEALRNMEVSIRESEAAPLDEGEYFLHDLVGMEVVTEAGEPVGRVAEVFATAANDVIVVRRPDAPEALIPMIGDVVRALDHEGRRIVIHPLEGLL